MAGMLGARGPSIIVGGVLTALLGLSACGNGADSTAGKEPSSPSSSASAESMKSLCPEVEKALRPYKFGPIKLTQLQQFQSDLTPIYDQGDLEAQNALKILRQATTKSILAYSDSSDITPGLTASETMDNAVSDFAKRCKAAGSSALQ